MNSRYSILVIAGEPNSVFLEIYFKSLKKLKIKKPLILIVSLKLIKLQMKKLKFKRKIKIINPDEILNYKLDNNYLNIIDVDYKQSKAFEKITSKSNNYIQKSFEIGFNILKENKIKNLITGPISKKTFLNKKYLGLTEYISDNFKIKKKCNAYI